MAQTLEKKFNLSMCQMLSNAYNMHFRVQLSTLQCPVVSSSVPSFSFYHETMAWGKTVAQTSVAILWNN